MALFLIVYEPEYPEEYFTAVEALVKSWGAKRAFGANWIVDMDSSERLIFDAIHERMNWLVDSIIIAQIDPTRCLAHRTREDLSEFGIPLSGC